MKKGPTFKDKKEEQAFWKKNEVTDYLDDMEDISEKLVDDRPKRIRTTIYLESSAHQKVRKQAFLKGISVSLYSKCC